MRITSLSNGASSNAHLLEAKIETPQEYPTLQKLKYYISDGQELRQPSDVEQKVKVMQAGRSV